MKSFSALLGIVPVLTSAAPTQQQLFAPKTVVEFADPTWLENIAATCDGNLLTGLIGTPDLYLVDPFSSSKTLIHTFTGKSAVFGISELANNNYAVIAGNYSSSGGPVAGTFSLFNVDLNNANSPHVSTIVNLVNSTLLNGLTSLNDHNVLISDSRQGNVVKVDTHNGQASIVLDDAALKTVPGSSFSLGANGIRYSNNYLYYTNTDQETLGRVKVNGAGSAIGPFKTIASNLTVADDFAVTDDHTIFLARGSINVINKITLDGKVTVAVGGLNSSAVAGPTSLTLGRTHRDSNIAYVSTDGGIAFPVNGTTVVAGKVVSFRYR